MAERQFLSRYARLSEAVHGAPQYVRGPVRLLYNDAATEWLEADIRGGVGRIALHTPFLERVHRFISLKPPLPTSAFMHGEFRMEGCANALG